MRDLESLDSHRSQLTVLISDRGSTIRLVAPMSGTAHALGGEIA
jgi:hypothetical protein